LTTAIASWAGPNSGTLVLHDAGIAYSDLPTFCGVGPAPAECEQVDSRIDAGDWPPVIWKIYAAFAPCTSPRMAAVYFGVQYDPVPSQTDPVMAYGILGFNQPGQTACIGWFYGACCHVDGSCSVTSEGECLSPDIWVGCTTCFPEACWIMDATGPGTSPGTIYLAMTPNPMRRQGALRFRVAAGAVTVGVHDAAGRRIRRLFSGEAGASLRSTPWDGRDDAGRLAPAGAYYLRLETAGERRCAPFVLLR
jgi:hypothetical protein